MSQDLEQNKQTAKAFYELAFNQSQPAEAMRLYGGPSYRQHTPETRDGKDGFIEFVTGFCQRFPQKYLDIRFALAEGDRVVLHVFAKLFPEDRGAAIFDMFRFEHGKIVEHWDAIQPIPEHAQNSNTMF